MPPMPFPVLSLSLTLSKNIAGRARRGGRMRFFTNFQTEASIRGGADAVRAGPESRA